MIRVPVEACFPDTRPAWRQRSDASSPVHSRLLYYVLEEGYLRGYESPENVDERVESFQLTSHRIEVNAMYSLNIFEIKARAVNLHPQFVEDTSSSSSDSSDDDDDSSTKRVEPAVSYMPQKTISSSPAVISRSYHVVFFAANKELVKKWSVKLLNWNRFVFGPSDDLHEGEHKLAKTEITHALHVVNSTNRFLRPVEILPTPPTDTGTNDTPANTSLRLDQVSIIPVPAELPTLANDSSTITPTESAKATPVIDSVDVIKLSDSSIQPPNSWWVVPFGRHRKISSYSLRS